jgi:hypothetical protein
VLSGVGAPSVGTMTDPTEYDPTSLRNQPAMRAGSEKRWLIAGGILLVVAGTIFAFLMPLQFASAGMALSLLVAGYLAMIVSAIFIRSARAKSMTLAWLMAAMGTSAVIGLVVLIALEWAAGASSGHSGV